MKRKPDLRAAQNLRARADYYAAGAIGTLPGWDQNSFDWWTLQSKNPSGDLFVFSQAKMGTEASLRAAADAAESAAYSDAMIAAEWSCTD